MLLILDFVQGITLSRFTAHNLLVSTHGEFSMYKEVRVFLSVVLKQRLTLSEGEGWILPTLTFNVYNLCSEQATLNFQLGLFFGYLSWNVNLMILYQKTEFCPHAPLP